MFAGHLDLKAPLVWTVDDALTPADCAAYVARIESRRDAEVAPIVGHDGAPEVDLAVRNNTRVMWDDEEEANALLARVAKSVPAELLDMKLAGANPRLRLYRYAPGQKHGAHWDTVVELAHGVKSLLTQPLRSAPGRSTSCAPTSYIAREHSGEVRRRVSTRDAACAMQLTHAWTASALRSGLPMRCLAPHR